MPLGRVGNKSSRAPREKHPERTVDLKVSSEVKSRCVILQEATGGAHLGKRKHPSIGHGC